MKSQPGIRPGLLIGTLLTVPLLALFYLGWRLAGLAFVPFVAFDWLIRLLPGSVLTFGIDVLVKVIRALRLGETSSEAKAAEQLLALAGFVVIGALATAGIFFVGRLASRRWVVWAGWTAGVVVGLAVLSVALIAQPTLVQRPLLNGLWEVGLFSVWGALSAWAYRRLSAEQASATSATVSGSPGVHWLDRRRFVIRLGGVAALVTVVGATLARLGADRGKRVSNGKGFWSSTHPLPNADASVQPVPGTRPELTPVPQHYRIDINTIPPAIDASTWRLKVNGLTKKPVEMTLAEIRGYPSLNQFITLSCISNPIGGDLIGTTRWTGVSLKHLLPGWQLKPEATHLKIQAADGFYEIVPLDVASTDERVMLAYDWDGVPLPVKHGFPLRIYLPDRYGMKQPKWIESIEATDHWEPGYWVTRGWDKEARMKATSVIDAIAVAMKTSQADKKTLVPIGGIAHAGARGISKVEVRVDDGEWKAARLRTPLSPLTWVIWRYDWPFQKGKHVFTVRCSDGNGAMQIAEERPPHPSGATGYESRSAMI